MKPFVIWHNKNSRALKHINKLKLSVYYRSNEKLWVTQLLFQIVILDCSASEMEKYCLENNISFKISFIVDNSPGHLPFIDDFNSNMKVVFLPLSTTFFI